MLNQDRCPLEVGSYNKCEGLQRAGFGRKLPFHINILYNIGSNIYGAAMQMVRVNSSAIVAIGYDGQTARMRIQFQQGHSYDFCRVPASVHAAFMRAYSKGIYYNDHIKDRYQC